MRYFSWLLIFVLTLTLLTSCVTKTYPTISIEECWMNQIESNPSLWTRNTSTWFRNGDLSLTGRMARMVPYAAALSNMTINVPNFHGLKIVGDFKVELFGAYKQNSVYVVGPNQLIRNVSFEVQGNNLVVRQLLPNKDMRNVVVRIGVKDLRRLVQEGNGTIEGIQMKSRDLTIITLAGGDLYLSGDVILTHIIKNGCGNITVMGGNSGCLDIETNGPGGSINLFGQIGLRSIAARGCGNINIIGGFSTGLKIYSEGTGKIGILPTEGKHILLLEVAAKNASKIYVCGVRSPQLVAFTYNNATVGVSGEVKNLYVNSFDQSCFLARNLCAMSAYVRTHGYGHAAISTAMKMFGDAESNSTIYFFGPPGMISGTAHGRATITPFYKEGTGTCMMMQKPMLIKKAPPPSLVGAG